MICRSLAVGRAGAVTSSSGSAAPVPGDHFLCTPPLAGIVPARPRPPLGSRLARERTRGVPEGRVASPASSSAIVTGVPADRLRIRVELPELSCFESASLTEPGVGRARDGARGAVRKPVRSRDFEQFVGAFGAGCRLWDRAEREASLQNARCPGMQGSHAGASYWGNRVCVCRGWRDYVNLSAFRRTLTRVR
jgi:hypothetical protein